MTRWSDLATRNRQPEVMDQPGLDREAHQAALRSLARINFWSGSAGVLWPPVRRLAERLGMKSLSVLDLATGAGDVPLALEAKARAAGLDLRITGCDVSPCAIDQARETAARSGSNVRFEQLDVLTQPLTEQYDVVTCSLFLHHLDDVEAVKLLRIMAASARHLVLVNDLERSAVSYYLVKLATRLLSRSKVVWIDGPRSVEGAYSLAEMRALAVQAGLKSAEVERRHPCRMLLSWSPGLLRNRETDSA